MTTQQDNQTDVTSQEHSAPTESIPAKDRIHPDESLTTIPEEATVTLSEQDPPSYDCENASPGDPDELNLRRIFSELGAEEDEIGTFLADIRDHPHTYANDKRPCIRKWATKLIAATPVPEVNHELEHLRNAVLSGGDRLERLEVHVGVLMKGYNSLIRNFKDLRRCVEQVATAPVLIRPIEQIRDDILKTKVRQATMDRRLLDIRTAMADGIN
jgi:hypothetical protein